MLLEKGADIGAQTKSKETPLHYAARNKGLKALDIVRLLMEKRANIILEESQGVLLRYVPQSEGPEALAMVQMLLEK